MKYSAGAAAAALILTLFAAPLAAYAADDSMTVDLKGLDLRTDLGQKYAHGRVNQAVDAYCGDRIQNAPIVFLAPRMACRAEMTKLGMAVVAQVKTNQEIAAAQPVAPVQQLAQR